MMKANTMSLTGLLALALTARAADWQPVPGHIMTRWAAQVDPARPHPEHPRPQMVRPAWQNLNGLWQFEITGKDAPQPAQFSRKILVPYPVESALSGVKKKVEPKDRLWYRRGFTVPAAWHTGRVLLHFVVADWSTEVFVNGTSVGRHVGGYDPFGFDVTEALQPGGEQTLVVSVWDPTNEGGQPIGKQTLGPGGIFYTATSGLWGTVWIEAVPKTYVQSMKLVPDIDAGVLKLTVQADGGTVRAVARDGTTKVGEAGGKAGEEIAIHVPKAKLWTPDKPFLYDLDIELTDGATKDAVQSYFGMRKIAIGPDEKGVMRILLNNKYVFHAGPLDQGFWPDGLYTAPTDEALQYDVAMIKAYGFNMARKHVKGEPDRWDYGCDKLGVMVWQDMPSGGNLTRERKKQFELELQRMIATHYNHPSIVLWVVFNEGWGQFDTERLVGLVRQWDPHRLITGASGGWDMKVGDVLDDHLYPFPPAPRPTATRAAVAGECGGLAYNVKGHTWSGTGWGYGDTPGIPSTGFANEEELAVRYEEVLGTWLRIAKDPGISGGVYTELTDIETEINGVMTYDRAVLKIQPDVSRGRLNGWLPPRKINPADLFVGTGKVELETAGPGVKIVYTLDGSDPTAQSTIYQQPIAIARDTVVKARAVWPDGGLSRLAAFPMKSVQPTGAVAPGNVQPGLQVKVYDLKAGTARLPDFTPLPPAQTAVAEQINLKPKTRNENFGLVFDGFLNAPATGAYVIRVTSDDGAEVVIDGKPACGKDGVHGDLVSTATVALAAGAHPLRVRYFQGGGGQTLRLEWAVPGGRVEEIPASAFSHAECHVLICV
ncbi:MAG: PA14 domain-containing protein [Kiritimatiellaeota bacterium]|nr:PA14 domain-containing protein [Kiritimatiellota bacterium]